MSSDMGVIGNREVEGYLRADGKVLRNGRGEELLLRGVGMGGWLLPEGYMLRLPKPADRPRRIEGAIEELVGAAYAEAFWESYRERYVAESDIARVAEEGMNSVRLPLSARGLVGPDGRLDHLSPGLRALDRILEACERHRVYAILDLHAAPGGQTGANIDDSERDEPELFTDPAKADETVGLWRALAERYRDRWIVAGYDLLNEPLPNAFSRYNPLLVPLYERLIAAIREVDDRHLIILEGAHWATDWSIFARRLDGNALYQFHKYWNAPDAASLEPYLEARERLDAPIFMGEGGENNRDWYAGAFPLFEELGISWSFWTWKKMGVDNSPCCVLQPKGWERIQRWLEGGEKPGIEESKSILDSYLDGIRMESCAYRRDVVDAIERRPGARVPAVFFERAPGYGHEGLRGFREGEGFDIRFLRGLGERPNFKHDGGEPWKDPEWLFLRLHQGERVSYRFSVTESGRYSLLVSALGAAGAGNLAATVDGYAARDEAPWRGVLAAGPHRLELVMTRGCADLLWLRFLPYAGDAR